MNLLTQATTVSRSGEAETVLYTYTYSIYRELLSGNYGEVAYLYNDQYGVTSDDNGLYYMRARYYNIDIKRFINQDILTGSIDSSQSLNRYAYVEGNPVNFLDPFGLIFHPLLMQLLMEYRQIGGNGMIYNNHIKTTLSMYALYNWGVLIISYGSYTGAIIGILIYVIEFLYLIHYCKRINRIKQLMSYGTSKIIMLEDVEIITRLVRARNGRGNIHVKIKTKEECSIGAYEGKITIPELSYRAFDEVLKETRKIEVLVDPKDSNNYYMCLEKVAASRWIPNNCKIEQERKFNVLFWLAVNIIIIFSSIMSLFIN